VVHQEAPLIDTMSVAECIAIFRGYPTAAFGRVRWRKLNDEAAAMLRRFGVKVSPRRLAGKLNPAERALVALVIALDRVTAGLELLVLDEVTASLPEDQAAGYLERVAAIAESGVAVLMVTHRLSELKGVASRITVLRDGRRVYTAPAGELDEEGLVAHMVGGPGKARPGRAGAASAAGAVKGLWSVGGGERAAFARREAAAVDHLSGEFLHDVSFAVGSGEIVGVAGLVDSGVGELPQVLGGCAAAAGRRHPHRRPGTPRALDPARCDCCRRGAAAVGSAAKWRHRDAERGRQRRAPPRSAATGTSPAWSRRP